MGIHRREFLRLAGMGGAMLLSGLGVKVWAAEGRTSAQRFTFVQMSDTHVGFTGPAINPEAATTTQRAVDQVNAIKPKPDFVIVSGDLTHTTDDPQERRKRLADFKRIMGGLDAKEVRWIPGEHDAGLDQGAAFKEILGPTHYTFDHKGVHFITLDNVSDPTASIGQQQLDWFAAELAKVDKNAPIVVVTHRPLFDLYPDWDWATRDGDKAIELMRPYANVTVLYGHIHQEHHHMTGNIPHHAAKGLMYPLPAPGSVPKRAPVPWDPAAPFRGLGFRSVTSGTDMIRLDLAEFPLKG